MDFNQAQFTCSFGLRDQLPPSDTVELVFSGRSNVGKSSLINKLCTRKALARVSSTPGKTTTINFFSLGKDTTLVDLPGYGYAKRSHEERIRWANLMEHYFKSDRNIKLVLLLIDSRHKPSDEDFGMLEFL
ncbi:MAG: ribosome biogenesis GTP-binding protein YihA/YsxC, partial [Oscillospiraceae bacterium]